MRGSHKCSIACHELPTGSGPWVLLSNFRIGDNLGGAPKTGPNQWLETR